MTYVKICGITRLEDALKAVHLGADALGFVFAQSKRRINPCKAKTIVSKLPENVEKIGVFVNSSPEEVLSTAQYCSLTGLQFHGEESPQYCREFINNYTVIKAFRVNRTRGWDAIPAYRGKGTVDRILLDTYVEGIAGGTGKAFPWRLLETKNNGGDMPTIIAGGINSTNVKKLLHSVNPYGIDVSSGVEHYPGKKDHTKLEELFYTVKPNF